MTMSVSSRRFAAWLTALALLLGALAPAVAQVTVAARGDAGWVQICGVSGVTWVQVGTDAVAEPAGQGEHPGDGARHCPWCHLGGSAGLPPVAWRLAVAEPAFVQPPDGLTPLAARSEWPSALSRAPPQA